MGIFDWLKGKSPDKARRPRDDAPPGKTRKVGDRVLASWLDAYFYPGRVRQVQGASCEIAFDDGDVAWVDQANVRRPDIETGSQVFCRFHAGPAYLPGTVRQQNGEKIQVQYENGEKEWTTLSMVRVKRPLADVAGPPAQLHQGPGMPQGTGMPGPMMGGGMGGPMTGTMTATGPMMGPPVGPFIPDVGDPVSDSNWRTGDRVLGRWFDFFWYPATILAIGTKGYHLLFDDGDQRVVQDLGLMPIDIEEGEELFIRPKNQPQRIFTPARVTRVKGEMIDVELEDGTQETNQKISRARLWRCPVGMGSVEYDEGDRVWATDIDAFIYPAEVLSVDHDKIVVQFLDGPERMLTPELLKPFELRIGTPVQCRWKGGQAYFPGKITQMEGDRVHLAYDDGDKEWTTVRLVRLMPKEGRPS
jgi:DNA repair protein Crb2 Tudor domain/Agenet domain